MSILADFLLRQRDAVVERFKARVGESLAPGGLSESELQNDLPDFLEALTLALREDTWPPAARVFSHNATAEEHGRQRLDVGFSLDSLTREYGLLHDCILELLEEAGEAPTLRELRLLAGCLSGAGADSVTQYVHHQQALLRQAQEFHQRLLGIVGHDVRGPLSAITLSTATLLGQQGLAPVQERSLRRIARSAERIEGLVALLLDFTRAQLGLTLPIRPGPVCMESLCERVLDEVQTAHPGRALLLESEGDTCGEWDPDRLMQVLGNLVSNAVRYSPAEAPVSVRIHSDRDGVTLQVHNLGPPIPPEALPNLFLAFHRGEQAESVAREGMGLGLYIVGEVVKAHEGTITVDSSEERGTTFTVTLPRLLSRSHPAEPEQPKPEGDAAPH